MSEASSKVVKISSCKIARHVIEEAEVEFAADGSIYSYDVNRTRDVIDMNIIYNHCSEPGDDLIDDTEEAIKIAKKAIKRHGSDKIELLINREEEELYVHYHSNHDSVCLYEFEGYSLNDDFVLNYIKEKFEDAEIEICEY